MTFLSKYGVARHIYIPIIKAGSNNHAVGADWTPAAGDVKISKDGGAAANVTNLPTAIAMGNSTIWDFSLTATEMQAAQVIVTVADSATKAVEDDGFIVETYGNASGQHALDLGTATQSVNVTQFGGTNGTFAAGRPEVNTTHIAGSAVSTAAAQIGVNVVNAGGTAWASGSLTSGVFAAGAINAAAIAADAIGASELAADAVAEIADAIWDEARAGHVTAGTFGEGVASVQGNVTGSVASVTGAVGSVTGNVGGNVVGSIGSVAANGITASSIATDAIGAAELAADAVAEIADAIWDEARAGHVAAGSFGEGVASVQGNVTGTVASVTGAVGSVTGAVGSVTGNVGGNVVGSVASVTGNVAGNVTGSVGSVAAGGITAASIATDAIDSDAIAATAVTEIQSGLATAVSIAALNNLSAAQVNAEVVDALNVDTYAEPGQEAPGATISLAKKIGYLYKFMRNKLTQTSTTLSVFADDATTVDQKATVSDDGTTYTRGEIGTGP